MQDFISTRPRSVVAAFFLSLANVATGFVSCLSLSRFLSWESAIEGDPGAPLPLVMTSHFMTTLMVVAAFLIPVIAAAALWRDSRLGYRAFRAGTIVVTILSLAANIFPARCLLEAALVAWMAYELDGFNVLTWLDAKLTRGPV